MSWRQWVKHSSTSHRHVHTTFSLHIDNPSFHSSVLAAVLSTHLSNQFKSSLRPSVRPSIQYLKHLHIWTHVMQNEVIIDYRSAFVSSSQKEYSLPAKVPLIKLIGPANLQSPVILERYCLCAIGTDYNAFCRTR